MMPIYELNFKDFKEEFGRLTNVVDNNSNLNDLYWYETEDSFILYFNSLYTHVSKVAIENSNEYDSVNDFKVKFLVGRKELVRPVVMIEEILGKLFTTQFVISPAPPVLSVEEKDGSR